MAFVIPRSGISDPKQCLPGDEPAAGRTLDRAVWRAFRALPLRERSLLKLIYQRGATTHELAGALGISPAGVRRAVAGAVERASDPIHLNMVACWNRLDPREQRLMYLHRVLALSLRQIVREGLLEGAGRASLSSLRREVHAIEQKVARLCASSSELRA
jgi:hypothetical protein